MQFNARLIAAAAAAVLSTAAQAGAVHVYDATYDGATTTYSQSASGQSLAVGDEVQLTVHAVGGYWSMGGATSLWAPVQISNSGTRTGDLVMSLLAGANTIQSKTLNGGQSSFVHIANSVTFDAADFDGFTWTYTLTDTTTATNVLGALLVTNIFVGGPAFVAGELPGTLPEPTSVLLAGLGLAAAGLARRRKA